LQITSKGKSVAGVSTVMNEEAHKENLKNLYGWIIRCSTCGRLSLLPVGFNLKNVKQLYLYCPRCKANKIHYVVGRSTDVSREILEASELAFLENSDNQHE